jgi:hypothetical protein
MIQYTLGEKYRKITSDNTTLNVDCFAIKALGGDVVVDATANDSDNLSGQTISDGDIISSLTGWSSVTKKSGGGTVIIFTND